jgi:glutamine amidotransferase
MITIVDYGMGNLGSVRNMLKKIGVSSQISSAPEKIAEATKLILPGVGAFDNAMQNLENLGLIPVLNRKVIEEKTPLLGICLGMQLLTKRSEEGSLSGLGWIDAETVRFRFSGGENLKIPHMGWNTISLKKESPLYDGLLEEPRFYFVHSYFVACNNPSDVITTTDYGIDFCSSLACGNVFGVQFHPEKSHKFGMRLLKNFAELC